VRKLRAAPISSFKSRDIFRASQLPLLGLSNEHLRSDQKKIRKGKKLSPLLLVRDTANGKVVIADGYHRLCAAYTFDEGRRDSLQDRLIGLIQEYRVDYNDQGRTT